MNRIRESLSRVMIGRYGTDELGKVNLYCALFFLVLSMFIRYQILYIIALLLLAVSYFRMFSRNSAKRYRENQQYLNLKYKAVCKVAGWKQNIKIRKTHHIYRCTSCHQKVKVPRGKGKISIRCPKCNNQFIKKS